MILLRDNEKELCGVGPWGVYVGRVKTRIFYYVGWGGVGRVGMFAVYVGLPRNCPAPVRSVCHPYN